MNSVALDVFIGLTLIFCLYSFLASTINELIASVLGLRSKKLEKAIKRMLTDDQLNSPLKNKLLDAFNGHALIKYMNSGNYLNRRPSYISPANFSKILSDILKSLSDKESAEPLAQIKKGLETFRIDNSSSSTPLESETIKLIKSFLDDAKDDLEKFRTEIERWFNDTMDRATGWYKRQSQWIVLAIGFILSMVFNVNTFDIVKNLAKDKTARAQLISIGTGMAKDSLKFNRTVNENGDSVNSQALLDSTLNYVKTDLKQANVILGLGWDFTSLVKTDSLEVSVSAFVKQEVLNKILILNKTIDSLGQNAIKLNSDSLKACIAVNKKLYHNYIGIFNDSTQSDFITISKIQKIHGNEDSLIVIGKREAGLFPKIFYVAGHSLPWQKSFWGFLITALMISLGAPFWFDLLSKFVQLRGTGPRISTKPSGSNGSPARGIDSELSILTVKRT